MDTFNYPRRCGYLWSCEWRKWCIVARKPEIVVAGLGVAGATLAYYAALRGFDVEGYDPAPNYMKACGDAVTLKPLTRRLVEETGSVVGGVKRYLIAVNGQVVSEFTFTSPVWAIVDKGRLVMGLREMAVSEGARLSLRHWRGERGVATVDARGPYSSSIKEAVFLYRVIAPSMGSWDDDTALLDFNVRERGVYWIFPSGDGRVNVGAGFESLWNAGAIESRLKRYYKAFTGAPLEPVDRRGAPMQLFAPLKPYEAGVFKVGEAGGFLLRTGGEGNRMAMLTGKALADALSRGWGSTWRVRAIYAMETWGLRDEVQTSRMLLWIVARSPPGRAEDLLSSLPRWFWIRFVQARVRASTLASMIAIWPGLGVKVARSLLSALALRAPRQGS